MEINSSQYPNSAWRVPYIHSLFENAASVASGISAALRAKGNDHTTVVVIAGDGATYDIGFGALSGMFERNDDVLYVCYDNELYANTGVQKSGATPFGAATNTTQVGSVHRGKEGERKQLVEIAAAHGVPYAAQTNIAFIHDVRAKVKKAQGMRGARLVNIFAPCALGAGFDGSQSIKIARLAAQTRMCPMFEVENGEYKLSVNVAPAQKRPVEEYLCLQHRFKHLSPADIASVQQKADRYWNHLMKLCGQPTDEQLAGQEKK
jgi:pyruvate ferredoxin oxidoreductase beta subunit